MYTIGRLARRARIKADSIRFYERQGLIAPATKTPAGYRLYTDPALRRLVFIKHAQRCGLSLAEIGELLQLHEATAAARSSAYRLAAEKKREIDESISMLQAMSNALEWVVADSQSRDEKASAEAQESPLILALETCLSEREAKRRDLPEPGSSKREQSRDERVLEPAAASAYNPAHHGRARAAR